MILHLNYIKNLKKSNFRNSDWKKNSFRYTKIHAEHLTTAEVTHHLRHSNLGAEKVHEINLKKTCEI